MKKEKIYKCFKATDETEASHVRDNTTLNVHRIIKKYIVDQRTFYLLADETGDTFYIETPLNRLTWGRVREV